MIVKCRAVLSRRDDDFEVAVEARHHLREQFLKMPFEQFVKVKELRNTFREKKEVYKYLSSISYYLDFETESYKYFMTDLEDAKTAEMQEMYLSHDIHTDMWGRIKNHQAYSALSFAMGFECFSKELGVEEMGYECDLGSVEETLSTEFGDVQISGYKNINGNYHGYCQMLQADGTYQRCFFNDGTILGRRIYYPNGMSEVMSNNSSLAVDIFVPRTVYEIFETQGSEQDDDIVLSTDDDSIVVKKVLANREMVEEIYKTLGDYSLHVEYRHYVEYPYDEGEWETEKAARVPSMNMALLKDGKLMGVVFKTNGYTLIPLDAVKRSNNQWTNCVIGLDEDISEGEYKLSLRKNQAE